MKIRLLLKRKEEVVRKDMVDLNCFQMNSAFFSAKQFHISEHKYDEDREFYIVQLDEDMEQGKNYVIKIKFTAILRDGLKGFYRSSYKNDQGETM